MQKTTNYGLNKPEAADFYNVEDFNENMDVIDAKLKEVESTGSGIDNHIENKENPHEVTKAQVGLSNVPNVSTNNQTPTYSVPDEVSELTSGEKLSAAFGKIARFMINAIAKLANIEAELGNKVTDSFTANTVPYADDSGKLKSSTVTANELSSLIGVKDRVQTQLDAKLDKGGHAVNKAVVTDGNGNIAPTGITSAEIGALSGVTSNIQTQLNAKLSKSGGTMTGNLMSRSIIPETDNTYHLGTSSSVFQTVRSSSLRADYQNSNYVNAYVQTIGTASTLGYGRLTVGNSTPKGTAGNARGQILVYDENGHYVSICAKPNTANPALELPTKSGTIPVASLSGTTLTINF